MVEIECTSEPVFIIYSSLGSQSKIKNIHQLCYHLVHSVCAISMNILCVIKARQGIRRKFLKLVFVITSKQMVDII